MEFIITAIWDAAAVIGLFCASVGALIVALILAIFFIPNPAQPKEDE